MARLSLYPHQQDAVEKLRSGNILCAGVGTGKSLTAIAYFYLKECAGSIGEDGSLALPTRPKDLYIITTAQKRDKHEWDKELSAFLLSTNKKLSILSIGVTVDSWNNIQKYAGVQNAFFIFDEQRLVGSGAWVKSFLKISRANRWILLSATPGDTWMDYIPVFLANGFYKNRTEFLRRHAVYDRYSKYPKVDHYVETANLEILRRKITVTMRFLKSTMAHHVNITTDFDPALYKIVVSDRWNPYENRPIQNISEVCYLMRKVVNGDRSRLEKLRDIMKKHKRLIIFYNFDYELEMLKNCFSDRITIAQWNGHRHETVPNTDSWLYLVQYAAGAEGWNCITTNAIVFFSQNYSYKIMTQAAGRIDRLNTPYTDLYYYNLKSRASIDISISRCLSAKQNFNEKLFLEKKRLA